MRIKMEDPQPMGKDSGCMHRAASEEINSEQVMEARFDTKQYFRSAVKNFIEITGRKLTPVASPHTPRLPQEKMNRLPEQKEEFVDHAASLLMKLICGTRMALPSLSVVISRLAGSRARL